MQLERSGSNHFQINCHSSEFHIAFDVRRNHVVRNFSPAEKCPVGAFGCSQYLSTFKIKSLCPIESNNGEKLMEAQASNGKVLAEAFRAFRAETSAEAECNERASLLGNTFWASTGTMYVLNWQTAEVGVKLHLRPERRYRVAATTPTAS